MTITRRDFLKKSGLTFAFTIAGVEVLLTPAEAYAKSAPLNVLDSDEASILEAVTEILLPGAKQAGVVHFVDYQISVDANDSLLVLKYFNYPPPYSDFYQSALQEINKLSHTLYGSDVKGLNQSNSQKLIALIRDGNPDGWNGPPAPLVYHALRNDAVDVVYGTVEGFKKLGIPYQAHILPPEGWNNG
jgi:hypothetical protein